MNNQNIGHPSSGSNASAGEMVLKMARFFKVDNERIAERYHHELCKLFPGYRDMIVEALNSIPIESIPLHMNVPVFFLSIFERRLRQKKASNRK